VIDPDAVPAVAPGAPDPPGGSPVVDWITRSTRRDRTVISAIPLGFVRYATVVVPEDDAAKTRADAALVEVLQAHTPEQPWWLGYLDTGVADLVDPDAPEGVGVRRIGPTCCCRAVAACPDRAKQRRQHALAQRPAELVFPADRSWLVSTMWDDDWRCVGGTGSAGRRAAHAS
jgi:hypothetical protein